VKYPPRDAYRIRPPFEVPAQKPRRLIAGAIFVAGFAIAVLGAFHEVGSTGKEPTTHLQPYSPLPTSGSFQVLGNPESHSSVEATPSPSAVLVLHQREVVPTPLVPLYAPNQGNPSPVQVWSPANLLTSSAALAAVDSAAAQPPAVEPPVAVIPQSEQADPVSTPTPQPPSTPTPSPQPSTSPTPTPKPSPTPTPQPLPSTTPTPQPSASAGSPSCVPTKKHPCQQRGENQQ